jgi:Protein of unknown function (DUF3606)
MTTTRGRNQDRKRVAGGQDYEVGYESQKTSKSRKQVRSAESGQQPPQGRTKPKPLAFIDRKLATRWGGGGPRVHL